MLDILVDHIDIIFGLIAAIAGAIIGAITGYILNERSVQRRQLESAGNELEDAFIDEFIKFERSKLKIEGTKIYDILKQSYPGQRAVVHRFRSNLNGQKLFGFNTVWHQYLYPDNETKDGLFGYYITPDKNGNVKMIEPKFVSHKIESILTYAKQ